MRKPRSSFDHLTIPLQVGLHHIVRDKRGDGDRVELCVEGAQANSTQPRIPGGLPVTRWLFAPRQLEEGDVHHSHPREIQQAEDFLGKDIKNPFQEP